jgi:hypothetical protein
MAKKPPLTLVRSTPKGPAPPRSLDKPGLSLWNSIQTEYDISDSGGAEMLLQACGALVLMPEQSSPEVPFEKSPG